MVFPSPNNYLCIVELSEKILDKLLVQSLLHRRCTNTNFLLPLPILRDLQAKHSSGLPGKNELNVGIVAKTSFGGD